MLSLFGNVIAAPVCATDASGTNCRLIWSMTEPAGLVPGSLPLAGLA
jgi:hypothetical protein